MSTFFFLCFYFAYCHSIVSDFSSTLFGFFVLVFILIVCRFFSYIVSSSCCDFDGGKSLLCWFFFFVTTTISRSAMKWYAKNFNTPLVFNSTLVGMVYGQSSMIFFLLLFSDLPLSYSIHYTFIVLIRWKFNQNNPYTKKRIDYFSWPTGSVKQDDCVIISVLLNFNEPEKNDTKYILIAFTFTSRNGDDRLQSIN